MGYKRFFRKAMAVLLAVVIVGAGCILHGYWDDRVLAADDETPSATPSVTAYATKTQLMTSFEMDGNGNDVTGRLVFGKDSSGDTMEWYILGDDTGIEGEDMVLFAVESIGTAKFAATMASTITNSDLWADCIYENQESITAVNGHHYGASVARDELIAIYSGTDHFSTEEKSLMQITPLSMYDSNNSCNYYINDILYLCSFANVNDNNYIKVGKNLTLTIDMLTYITGNSFWLRDSKVGSSFFAYAATPDSRMISDQVVNSSRDLRPAVNIAMNNILFASAASVPEAPDSIASGTIYSGTAMKLRLNGEGKNIGSVIYDDDKEYLYAVADENAADDVVLVVQGNDGTKDWYYSRIISDTALVTLSGIENEANVNISSLSDCEIWIESETENVVYANRVKAGTIIDRVEATINTPAGNADFDYNIQCGTAGISNATLKWTDSEGREVSGKANYAPWEYIAEMEFETEDDAVVVEYPEVVINNGNVTMDQITVEQDGTIKATSWLIMSNVAKVINVDAPDMPDDNIFNAFYVDYAGLDYIYTSELGNSATITLEDGNVFEVDAEWAVEGEYNPLPEVVNTFRWSANILGMDYVLENGAQLTGVVDIANKAYEEFHYTSSGYSGIYDNNGHGITLEVTEEMDAIITYSRDGVTYNSVYPVFRDAGDYTVYYKIANDYYETVEGSETVSIEKAPITITAGNQTVDYGDDIDSELYQVTGLLTGHRIGSILLTPSTSDVTDNGRIDISDVVILNEDDDDVTRNYEITTMSGTLVVEATNDENYVITDGDNVQWTDDEDDDSESISISADGEFNKFIGVKVDSEFIDEADCTADDSKTKITLKEEYLKTLAPGEHVLEIVWMDGSVRTTFVITVPETESGNAGETPTGGTTGSTEETPTGSTTGSTEETPTGGTSGGTEEIPTGENSSDDDENNNNSGNEGNAGGGGTDNGDSSEDVGAGDRAYVGIYIAIFVVCIIAVMAVFRRRAEV